MPLNTHRILSVNEDGDVGGGKSLTRYWSVRDKLVKKKGIRVCIHWHRTSNPGMNFYELLLLEIQKLISAPLSPSLLFFSLWFSAA